MYEVSMSRSQANPLAHPVNAFVASTSVVCQYKVYIFLRDCIWFLGGIITEESELIILKLTQNVAEFRIERKAPC